MNIYYWHFDSDDELNDYVHANQVFRNNTDMHKYVLKSVIMDDDVVIQIDPIAVEGEFVEVLSAKAVQNDGIKLSCHSHRTTPAFCHDWVHKTKLMYSMVRDIENGYLFLVIFASHQGCSYHNNQLKCYWDTHMTEMIILDKSIVKA